MTEHHPNTDNTVRIRMVDIYNQQLETNKTVNDIQSKMEPLAGHETRLRKLETQIAGMFVIHGIALSGIAIIITDFLRS